MHFAQRLAVDWWTCQDYKTFEQLRDALQHYAAVYALPYSEELALECWASIPEWKRTKAASAAESE